MPKSPERLPLALAVSALVHALLLAIYILARTAEPPKPPPEAPGFEMVFPGGVRSPDAVPAPGKFTEIPKGQAIPAPVVPQTPNTQMSPPQATPAPEVNLLPPEMRMMAPPMAQPEQQAAVAPARTDQRRHARPRTAPNPSPFAHPQEFSLATTPSPAVSRGLRDSQSRELQMGEHPRGGELNGGALHFTSPGDDGTYAELLAEYVETHKYYPRQAAENNEQGVSVISATITSDGQIRSLRLVQSSGSAWLDMAWMGLFRAMRLPPFPPNIHVPQLDFTYSMEYDLYYR